MLRPLFFFAICLGISYGCYRFFDNLGAGLAPIGLLMCAKLTSKPMARLLIELVPAIKGAAEFSAHHRWQGRFYTFNEHHIRFYLVGDTVWIAEADVAVIMTPPPEERESRLFGAEYALIPGEKIKGYTETALLRMLSTRNASRRPMRDMVRFKAWLEIEALPNVKRLPSSSAA